MKQYISYLIILIVIFSIGGCSEDKIGPSIFDTSTDDLRGIDIWLRENYVKPYNIDVIYKWDDNKVPLSYPATPPTEEIAWEFAKVLLELWCNPYIKVAGEDFFKELSPKEIVLIGSYRYSSSGSIKKGNADGGAQILLYEVNEFDRTNAARLKRYLQTVHHEFTHVALQKIEYVKEFETITPAYAEQWENMTDEEAYDEGFVTPYAMKEPEEDFAEIVGVLLSSTKEEWQLILDKPSTDEVKEKLAEKVDMVIAYFRNNWEVDLYELRDACQEALRNIIND